MLHNIICKRDYSYFVAKKHSVVFFLRNKRFYAMIVMVVLIITSLISYHFNIPMRNTNHNENFGLYQPTNPPSNLYLSSDGNNPVLLGTDDKYFSKSFQSKIKAYNGEFFIVPKTQVVKNYYISPPNSLADGSCITGYDFFDFTGSGVKQWVFKCDLKTTTTIIFTLTYIPLSIIIELFNEIGDNVQSRYPVPLNEIRFPYVKLRVHPKVNWKWIYWKVVIVLSIKVIR